MQQNNDKTKHFEQDAARQDEAQRIAQVLQKTTNTTAALKGSSIKTNFYWLFSFIAFAELSAAIFFYSGSFQLDFWYALLVGLSISGVFHWNLHKLLTTTSRGVVFELGKTNDAMRAEVNFNIFLSVLLLFVAAFSVNYLGKKGYETYRKTQYENKIGTADSTASAPAQGVTAASLARTKTGKIKAVSLNSAAKFNESIGKIKEAEKTETATAKADYDQTTTKIVSIVGASAFVVELVLLLLAFGIANADKASVINTVAMAKAAGAQQSGLPQIQQYQNPQNTAHQPLSYSDDEGIGFGKKRHLQPSSAHRPTSSDSDSEQIRLMVNDYYTAWKQANAAVGKLNNPHTEVYKAHLSEKQKYDNMLAELGFKVVKDTRGHFILQEVGEDEHHA